MNERWRMAVNEAPLLSLEYSCVTWAPGCGRLRTGCGFSRILESDLGLASPGASQSWGVVMGLPSPPDGKGSL